MAGVTASLVTRGVHGLTSLLFPDHEIVLEQNMAWLHDRNTSNPPTDHVISPGGLSKPRSVLLCIPHFLQ
jgi:hypothetical protein